MSLKNKFFSIMVLAFAVVGFATAAAAQEAPGKPAKEGRKHHKFERRGDGQPGMHRGRHGKRGGRSLMRGLRRLELNDAQKTQMRGIAAATRTANQPIFQEMRGLIEKKRGGTITEAEQARLGELKNQIKATGEQTKNSVLAILTPEQRQQLERMKEEQRRRREERRQNRQMRTKSSDSVN